MMNGLQLALLGTPQLTLDGQRLTGFHTTKMEALLYYLAVTGRAHSREALADLLWGDMPEAKAKRNLTKALSNLRQLVEPYLLIERQSVAFNQATAYELDVAVFETSLEAAGAAPDLAALEKGVTLYRGDFLEGFDVNLTSPFAEWALARREALREVMLQAMDSLVDAYIDREDSDTSTGLAAAVRLLELDPLRESAHRQSMILLARSGDHSAALAQYETCRRLLAEALGIEPMAETTELYQRLKAAETPPPHNLPTQPDHFVGREQELQQLVQHLDDPRCRLLTLVGPGGIGKTTLALQGAARYVVPRQALSDQGFPDGVYFINLAPVEVVDTGDASPSDPNHPANRVASAIVDAFDVGFHGPTDWPNSFSITSAIKRCSSSWIILNNWLRVHSS